MESLHLVQGISLSDIAKIIGNKTSGYVSWLFKQLAIQARPFEEARRKGITAKLRKYERRPFDGSDEDKAYILGLKHGDLSAYVPFGDVTRVSTSTTHPALAELFTGLFSPYGHVSKYPRYKKDTDTYEWNLQAILDSSFGFLLEIRQACRGWVSSKDSTALAYLAGLIDAEGYIRMYPNPRTIGITVSIWNTDVDLIEFAYKCLMQVGYAPMKPYLHGKPGPRSSGFRIEMKKAYWRVMIASFDDAQSLLRRLPTLHREKIARKELALSVAKGDFFEKIADSVKFVKKSIKEETALFTKQAEIEFLQTHTKPNRLKMQYPKADERILG